MLSDRIETVGKNSFLPLSWICLLHMNNFGKTFSEKLFQTLLDRIESVGKNRFLPLSFKNKSFFYIYKYLLKEVKSRWFGIKLSLEGMNCFLLFPVRMERSGNFLLPQSLQKLLKWASSCISDGLTHTQESLNSLPAMGAHERPLFNELLRGLGTLLIFVLC